MSVQLPEDASCASLTRAKTTRLASSLAGALNMRPLPPARLVRPPGVALAGCRRTVRARAPCVHGVRLHCAGCCC